MTSHCCPECFGDPGLSRDIIPSRSTGRGTCDFCGTADVDLVEPQQLAAEFETLISIYEPATAGGKTLVEWLKGDWKLFSHPKMDLPHAQVLLAEILDDGDIVRKPMVPSDTYKSDGLARWGTLRDELMYKNRYFLDQALDRDRLEQLLGHLVIEIAAGAVWYRARMLNQPAPFEIGQMGAPPNRLASHGRANPPGIPYLYLGSQPDTAVAEIRPHTGETACVADFTIPARIDVIDLCEPSKRVSPFRLADASAVGQLRADIPFLERLGEELTRPVLPSGVAIDYIPSQYLCEFIKKCGFAGVVYRSSVSTGMNLALFDPGQAVGGTVQQYDVKSVTVQVVQKP
jgi:hypothetical protein